MTNTRQRPEEKRLEEALRIRAQSDMQRRQKKLDRINSLLKEIQDPRIREIFKNRIPSRKTDISYLDFLENLEKNAYRFLYGQMSERTYLALVWLRKNFVSEFSGSKNVFIYKRRDSKSGTRTYFNKGDYILRLKITGKIKVLTPEGRELLQTQDPVEVADFLNSYARF